MIEFGFFEMIEVIKMIIMVNVVTTNLKADLMVNRIKDTYNMTFNKIEIGFIEMIEMIKMIKIGLVETIEIGLAI